LSITAEQARNIADAFLECSKIIDKYLDNNSNKIDPSEYESINEACKRLTRASAFATTNAVGLAIDTIQNPASELKNVIDQTSKKINMLQNVGKVIDLVAGLTDLAAGIVSRDPGVIVTSVKNLDKLLIS